MSSGFGLEAAEPQPFVINAPPELVLGKERQATTSFTVTNLTGRPVRARMMPRGRNGADDAWLHVVGESEVPIGVGATVTVEVAVAVPPEAPGGQHLITLNVVPEDDTESVSGQSVSLRVPAPEAKPVKKDRHWLRLVLIIVGSLLALIGLLVVILITALALKF